MADDQQQGLQASLVGAVAHFQMLPGTRELLMRRDGVVLLGDLHATECASGGRAAGPGRIGQGQARCWRAEAQALTKSPGMHEKGRDLRGSPKSG